MAESALRGLVPRPQEIVAPTRSWNPLNPAFRDTVSSAMSNLLGSSNIAGREGYDRSRYADMLTGSVDFVPGVSEAAGVGDVRREVQQGNYPGAALAGVATALGVVPVIGDAAAKAVRGLDMSQAARMQRAQEQGFDVGTTMYHGSNSKIKEFMKSKIGARDPGFFGSGFYFTPDRNVAMDYAESAMDADRSGVANVTEAFLRLKNPFVWDMSDEGAEGTRKALSEIGIKRYSVRGDSASLANNEERKRFNNELRKRGNDGVIVRDEDGIREVVVFDPSNIRSINAAFDPAKRESANLMAGVGGVLAGGSALRALLPQEQERQPD